MIDDKRAVQLLTTLTHEPGTPSGVDLDRAVREGRRRRGRRRVSAALGVVAVTAAVAVGTPVALSALRPPAPESVAPAASVKPSTGSAPAALARVRSCEQVDLATPGGARPATSGDDAAIEAMDPAGRWLAGTAGDDLTVWRDRTVQDRATFPNGKPIVAAVSPAGVIVGSHEPVEDTLQAWAWSEGKLTMLKAGAKSAQAFGVNDDGTIAGWQGDADHWRAVVWEDISAEPIVLPLPAGYTTSRSLGISSDGTVLGDVGRGGEHLLYRWNADHRGGKVIPSPVVDGTTVRNPANFVAGDGWLAAEGTLDGKQVGLRYEVAAGRWTAVPAGIDRPAAVNARGWIVGDDLRTETARLFDGTKILTLPSSAAGGRASVRAVSADGRLLGGQAGGATLWTCS
ncbi:hypothetical protein [Symbioplanes lichenis]|uniref:hypothetical protein n=1 Tax=Symbioplanes lichenis TaxID=1629072 RepID=UPI002738D412|nr:hypothetical protein [Actinoplanes lichenis]